MIDMIPCTHKNVIERSIVYFHSSHFIIIQNQNMHEKEIENENEAKVVCIFNVPIRFIFIQFRSPECSDFE